MRTFLYLALAATLTVFIATPGEAKPRPTVDSGDRCWEGGSSDKGCEGLICWCCYSDGCWICNSSPPLDCAWDDQYREPPSKPLGGFDPGENRPKPIPPILTLHASM